MKERLLAWFQANGRDLAWRHTKDPYEILVSEVMAQQNPLFVSRVMKTPA
jgi:A/G-specific adenine glycosylase